MKGGSQLCMGLAEICAYEGMKGLIVVGGDVGVSLMDCTS